MATLSFGFLHSSHNTLNYSEHKFPQNVIYILLNIFYLRAMLNKYE